MKKDRNHKLEKLEIYVLAKELAIDLYKLTSGFPTEEKFGIVSQLRRAGASIGANIAEGHGRYHYKEEILFNYRARGSLFECYFFLDLAKDLKLISEKNFKKFSKRINRLGIKINNYINYIKQRVTK